jgi:DNA topoisomerase IB
MKSQAKPAQRSPGRLRYVSDTRPGYRRRRCGGGFAYFDTKNRLIRDEEVLARIRSLAVPPAYVNVWICPSDRGHLQATGTDARGRKQYRYHPLWRYLRDMDKFDRMLAFGNALPALRRKLRADLAREGWPREKVLALVVRLLDQTGMRVGNEAYVAQNGHFGLTTLRTRHVRGTHEGLELRFAAKGGQLARVTLADARLVRLIRCMQRLPGQRLFQYKDDAGKFRPVDSGMVNDYLKAATGNECSAKDFRTWMATVQAVRLLLCAPSGRELSERRRKQVINKVVAEVASQLRNTPAVCRRSYIHPEVLAGWCDGRLQPLADARVASHPRQCEKLTLRFLRRAVRERRRAALLGPAPLPASVR